MEILTWDSRCQSEEDVYFEDPNIFLKEHIDSLPPGKILLPTEGEGRNAIYAARKNWETHAFDIDPEEMKNASRLAKKYDVSFHYRLGGYVDIDFEPESMDVIAFIFAHIPAEISTSYYHKILKSLKPGGLVILEGFHRDNFNLYEGWSLDRETLFTEDELKTHFRSLTNFEIYRTEREIFEGRYHQDMASLIRLKGYK